METLWEVPSAAEASVGPGKKSPSYDARVGCQREPPRRTLEPAGAGTRAGSWEEGASVQSGRGILVATHDGRPAEGLIQALRRAGYATRRTENIRATLAELRADPPDAVLLSPLVPPPGEVEIRAIARTAAARDEPPALVLLLDAAVEPSALRAVSVEIADFLLLSVDEPELLSRIEVLLHRRRELAGLRRKNARLRDELFTDSKTGLRNDRYFRMRLAEEVARTRRYHSPLACVMMDLDGFKGVNDECDHVFGDWVLREFGRRVLETVREGDVLARIGGDEFGLLLPNAGLGEASQAAERFRLATESMAFERDPYSRRLSTSIGVEAYAGREDLAPEELLRRADLALLEAKRRGRNRVFVYHTSLEERAPGAGPSSSPLDRAAR